MSIEDIEHNEVIEACKVNKMFTAFEIWASKSFNSELLTYWLFAYDVHEAINKFNNRYPDMHIEYIR